jgi:hypothetical protein
MASSTAGGGRTDRFNDLPLAVQGRIGLFLTPQERANSRLIGRAESLVYSTHPAGVYRIKSKITIKLDFIPTFVRLVKTFGIFTDATGNLRVEDFRDMFPPSQLTHDPRLQQYYQDSTREIHERLPDAVRAEIPLEMMYMILMNLIGRHTQTLFRDFTFGLWPAEELSQELQSRTGREQPFSLVRVKRFSVVEADVQRMLQMNPQFGPLGRVGTQDPIANIQGIFGITLSHEIVTEKFRIA